MALNNVHSMMPAFIERSWNRAQQNARNNPLANLVETVSLFVLGYSWWGILGPFGAIIATGLCSTGFLTGFALYQNQQPLKNSFTNFFRRRQTTIANLQQEHNWIIQAIQPAYAKVKEGFISLFN